MNSLDKQMEELITRLNKAESRVNELEIFADKVVNWNEQFSVKERLDIGSLGQQRHFQQLAIKVLTGNT